MTSTTGSDTPSREAVRRAAVITHGRPTVIGPGLERLEAIARDHDVELLVPSDEAEKHHRRDSGSLEPLADIVVVLGGDGTTLRALQRFLGTGIPVLGVNFGRVGFLSAMSRDQMEHGLPRAFRGDYSVIDLPTLATQSDGARHVAVNDVVIRSADVGRMVELEWGLDAMAVSFVAPHSLHARALVAPKSALVSIANRTPDVSVVVIADGHVMEELPPGGDVAIRIGDQRTCLAYLSERSFFRRYKETFAP